MDERRLLRRAVTMMNGFLLLVGFSFNLNLSTVHAHGDSPPTIAGLVMLAIGYHGWAT